MQQLVYTPTGASSRSRRNECRLGTTQSTEAAVSLICLRLRRRIVLRKRWCRVRVDNVSVARRMQVTCRAGGPHLISSITRYCCPIQGRARTSKRRQRWHLSRCDATAESTYLLASRTRSPCRQSGSVLSRVETVDGLVRGNSGHELELLTVAIWLALAAAAPSANSVSSGGTSNRASTASISTIRSRCAAAPLRAASS